MDLDEGRSAPGHALHVRATYAKSRAAQANLEVVQGRYTPLSTLMAQPTFVAFSADQHLASMSILDMPEFRVDTPRLDRHVSPPSSPPPDSLNFRPEDTEVPPADANKSASPVSQLPLRMPSPTLSGRPPSATPVVKLEHKSAVRPETLPISHRKIVCRSRRRRVPCSSRCSRASSRIQDSQAHCSSQDLPARTSSQHCQRHQGQAPCST